MDNLINHKGYTMTNEQLETIRQLRAEGYAVIIWTPEEIGDADIDELVGLSISVGSDYLESVND